MIALLPLHLMAAAGSAAIYQVGPGETYTTIQSAIDAAVASGVSNEIRVRAAVFDETLVISGNTATQTITGGWNTAFDAVVGRTTIDAGGVDRVLTVTANAGVLGLFDLDLTGGEADSVGGGAYLTLSGNALVELERVSLFENSVGPSFGGSVSGGGIRAYLEGTSTLRLIDVMTRDNLAESAAGIAASGGGLSASAVASSSLQIENLVVTGNVARAYGSQVTGAGSYIVTEDHANLKWIGGKVVANRAEGDRWGSDTGSAIWLKGPSLGNEVRGVKWWRNEDLTIAPAFGFQVSVIAQDEAILRWTDSQVDSGVGSGVLMFCRAKGVVYANNLTIAGNSNLGVWVPTVPDESPVWLHNSIVFGNGGELLAESALTEGFNLIGVDPLFADTAPGTFTLSASSPARDAGDDAAPGGLGTVDLDGGARIVGTHVDLGAHEFHPDVFADGFESGDTGAWGGGMP